MLPIEMFNPYEVNARLTQKLVNRFYCFLYAYSIGLIWVGQCENQSSLFLVIV